MAWLLLAAAFLSGSIPFGLLIGRLRGVDIRQHGSKNIGATNVGRVLGRPWGFLCFGLDLLKGLLPTLAAGAALGMLSGPGDGGAGAGASAGAGVVWAWLGIMAAPILGHMFSPWVGFRGGKGVATGFGALLGVWPMLTLPAALALVVWVGVVKVTRYVGLASCAAAASLPVSVSLLTWWGPHSGWASLAGSWERAWPYLVVSGLLAGLVIFKHRGNLARTWAGTEFKVGARPPEIKSTSPHA
jgi:glycerol-3-phosphate acyltransferase PlsY